MFNILSVTFVPAESPLLTAIESISSKKIIVGATCLAFSNICLMPLSDSPTHIFNNEGPLTLIKFASDSVATAFASKVLPVPGGPYINIPLGGLIPNLLNASLCLRGHSTASFNSCFNSSRPPISFQLTFGFSIKTSLIAEGLTILSASLKSSFVTLSF